MQVKIPFAFNTRVIPKRHRTENSELGFDWMWVDLDEPSEEEAPLAARWHEHKSRSYPYPLDVETRWYKGRHWIPVWERDIDNVIRRKLTVERLLDETSSTSREGRTSNPLMSRLSSYLQKFIAGEVEAFDPNSYRTVVSSEREAAQQEILNKASQLICVDGTLWRAAGEPIYVLERGRIAADDDGVRRWRPMIMFYEASENPEEMRPLEYAFRLDRFDEMALEMKESTGLEVSDKRRADIFLPEAFQFDDDWEALLSGARREAERYRAHLERAPLDRIEQWTAFAKVVKAVENSSDRDDPKREELATATREWLACLAEAGEHFGYNLDRVLDRWDRRPIDNFAEGLKL